MPVPQGNITSTQTWSLDGDNNQAVEETQEEQVQEEADATEQEVVGSNSDV